MSLLIKSPEFSFVNFNNLPTQICENDVFYPLPVYKDFSIKGQVQIIADPPRNISEKLYIGICGKETVCDETNHITNGAFNSDLSNWTAVNTIWQSGQMAYNWNNGQLCRSFDVSQTVSNLQPGDYKLTLRYRDLSTFSFEINLYSLPGFTLISQEIISSNGDGSWKTVELSFNIAIATDVHLNLVGHSLGTGGDPSCQATGLAEDGFFIDDVEIKKDDCLCGELLLDEDIELSPLCRQYKWFSLFDETESLPIDDPYNLCSNYDNEEKVTNGNFNDNADAWTLVNFYWNAGKIVSNNVPLDNRTARQQISLNTGVNYKLSFNYTNALVGNEGLVRITDLSFNDVNTDNPTYTVTSDGYYEYEFTVPTDGNYYLIIYSQATPEGGFSLDNISVKEPFLFNITSSNSTPGYSPIPTGVYTREQLYAAISEIIEMPFSCEFSSCCPQPNIEFTHTADEVSIVYKIESYWDLAQIDFPEIEMDGVIEKGQCFKYCILDENKKVIACSNMFKRIYEDCFTTLVEYWNNENAFGFKYPSETVTNLIRLPFFAYGPDYPTSEKIYRDTGGNYRRLSTIIEKEYDVEVDKLPEWLHDMIVVALKHDNILFTTDRIALVRQPISQQGAYTPEWKRTIDFKAKAKFKFRKNFNGTNSNCKSSNTCL